MRILILTAQNREADWKKGYKRGANQYLTKPFEPMEFAQAVERLLSIGDDDDREFKVAEQDRADLLAQLEKFFD
jgi:DNA-binding response OmpR family regulator